MSDEADLLLAESLGATEEEAKEALALLFAAAREGHNCIESNSKIPSPLVDKVVGRHEGGTRPVIRYQGRDYLQRCWRAENGLLDHWRRLRETNVAPLEAPQDDTLLPAQKLAVEQALSASLTLIVGGPGTGKTFTSRKILESVSEQAPHFVTAVAAPTGKAAANFEGAKTLHALLHRRERLLVDFLLVDECSMIDSELMYRLFRAIKRGARLVLVGDPDQLPPVESGAPFADLVAMTRDAVQLTTCMRAETDELLDLAHATCRGEKGAIGGAIQEKELPSPAELAQGAVMRWEREIAGVEDPEQLLLALRRYRLLSLVRRGRYGVDALNARASEFAKRGVVPILVRSNDYELGLFNGEMGVLVGDWAYFEGERKVSRLLLPPFELAYCLSVHKAQGSEFDEVELALSEGSSRFGRSGLYTAVTRAKRKLTLYTCEGEWERCLAVTQRRVSGLQPDEAGCH